MSMLVICGYCLYSMNAYVKKLYFPIVIPHTGVFPYLAVYDQLSGLSITPEELNLTL